MYAESDPAIQRLRDLCLALPETFEKEAWGECTFRVTGGKMFAMTDNNHHGSKHVAVWVKAQRDVQEVLVQADPKRFFVPPYVGPKGWLGIRLDYKVDWEELEDILRDAFELSAPKRLLKTMAAGAAPPAAAKPRAKRAAAPRRKPSAVKARAKSAPATKQARRS